MNNIEVKAGDVIKYLFAFPYDESEQPIICDAISEVFEVTPSYCVLYHTGVDGKNIRVLLGDIVSVYRKVS